VYTKDDGVCVCLSVVFLRPKFPLFFVVKASSLSLVSVQLLSKSKVSHFSLEQ
jgi:hypothetical protein